MDDQLQPAQPVATAAGVPGVGPAPAGAVGERFPTPAPGMGLRYARLLLRRLLYAGSVAWRLLSPRLGWVLAIVALLGVVAVQALLLILPRIGAAGAGDTRVANLPPSAAVEAFLEGQARYDADQMWDALSPQLQSAMLERGGSHEALAAQAQSERASGQRYSRAEYVGGVSLEDSRRRYFYVVDITSPAPERSGMFTFVFTTDRDGKILDLKMGN